ncbi:juvenile hormone esterase isoform X1 [Drosophila eugracilis]|uniref:juvenile hormone esterase isoform X1 n=1 Tax=Drosophila eugracilis TaxID=29029 RepID=UPI0007E68238|nr:juvenile hormone esterase isoform X1 [Drosophila eugracilis]XP_017084126.1 juvenile hormone esterase isoform X1 [Drosophila eugracilis]XP_017084127.1 juvenile hormone esterase isoform X1 [Drosophila eugracilis]
MTTTGLRPLLSLLLLGLGLILFCDVTSSIAIAPSTFGTAIARAGKISNQLKETTAWKTLTSHPNSLVQLLPSRAMRVVQEVVRSLRKEREIVATTSLGKVRGRYQKYRSGERGGYYSFKGMRYGAAPTGAKRFRAAEPEKPWSGIRDASREGQSCPHKNMILDTFKGDEDCLFINVFTTRMPKEEETAEQPKLPVMVWLHGGGFSFGSGNSFLYGPDYLVAEDIVLVTLNYRLGPLGFLTAGPDAPGNQGLKDQVLALKWVRDNIAAFGGDPNQVTVFGESAGASSVQLLLLSPQAKGLFQRAISQSGSALNPWSMAASSSQRAARLAANLGYVGANNTEDILDFLRRVPAMKLVEAAPTTITAEDQRNNIGLPFVPVVEGYWNQDSQEEEFYEQPFLTQHPSDMYHSQNFNSDVAYMTGYNTHEAMLFIRRLRKNPQLLSIIENDFGRLVPQDLNVTQSHDRVTREIRSFYLGNKHVGIESVDEMIALLTDLMFLQGIRRTARNHAKFGNAPVYMYRFSFDGALGLYKRMLGIPRPGVCHGDELGYLFKFGFFNLSLDPKSMEVQVKNRMVRMWTNFAKYGTPTPDTEDPYLTTKWAPIDPTNVMNSLNYMDISANLAMKTNPEPERQRFWDEMYQHYNGAAM